MIFLLLRAKTELRKLFFSAPARGDNAERSDVDIASSGGDFDSFYFDVKEKTHSLLMIDVVNLNSKISDDLMDEIKKDGVVIYEKA